MSYVRKKRPVALSIGIMAGNEESSIASMLAALLRHSVLSRFAKHEADCAILVHL